MYSIAVKRISEYMLISQQCKHWKCSTLWLRTRLEYERESISNSRLITICHLYHFRVTIQPVSPSLPFIDRLLHKLTLCLQRPQEIPPLKMDSVHHNLMGYSRHTRRSRTKLRGPPCCTIIPRNGWSRTISWVGSLPDVFLYKERTRVTNWVFVRERGPRGCFWWVACICDWQSWWKRWIFWLEMVSVTAMLDYSSLYSFATDSVQDIYHWGPSDCGHGHCDIVAFTE